MKKLVFLVCIFIPVFFSCKGKTGIQGDNNDNNKVVVGDNNIITFNGKDYNRPINKDLSVNVSANNQVTDFIINTTRFFDFEESGSDYVNNLNDKEYEKYVSNLKRIKYKSKTENGAVIIKPDINYIDLFASGGPVTNSINDLDLSSPVITLGTDDRFFLTFPNLDLKVVNNSQSSVFFNKIVFNIRKSRPDRNTLITIIESLELTWALYKESWEELNSCKVYYNLYPYNTSNINYDDTPFSRDILTSIEGKTKTSDYYPPGYVVLSIENDLKAMGVKITRRNDYAEVDEKTLGKLYYKEGEFGFLSVLLAGKLVFSNEDDNGTVQEKSVKFKVRVWITMGGASVEALPSSSFNAKFSVNRNDYTVEVPVSNLVKPTDVERFNILIAADRSSIHDFTAKLYYNDTSFYETGPIQLHYFLPRSAADRYNEIIKEIKRKE
ncbi:MAG: hypothetical protein M3R36_08655 [Bacteroidota bacterium]|nr:hypothetical protein [Bacteroidota bacterium]